MIKVEHLSKSFGSLQVFKDLNLEFEDGETVAIIGPSGSGKSTFLRCLNLLEQPEEGSVTIGTHHYDSHHLTKDVYLEIRRATAMVFQSFNLFENKNVLNNVTLPMIVAQNKSKEEAEKIAVGLLKQVDLLERKNYFPSQLSGGQQQRVSIARALALDPEVILFDEPTSALDPELVGGVLDVIKNIKKENMTKIIVTHEMAFARDVADRVIFMEGGKVVEQGPAKEVINHPKEERTRQFLRKSSTINDDLYEDIK